MWRIFMSKFSLRDILQIIIKNIDKENTGNMRLQQKVLESSADQAAPVERETPFTVQFQDPLLELVKEKNQENNFI